MQEQCQRTSVDRPFAAEHTRLSVIVRNMGMRHSFRPICFVLIATAVVSASGATRAVKPPPVTPAAPESKHFLWRVTDVPVPFYILGSSHALRASDYPLGRVIDDSIRECHRFVFECDFKHRQAEWVKDLQAAAHYPKGVTLQQKISPKTYAYLRKIAQIPASHYDNLRPWAIAEFRYTNRGFYGVSTGNGVESYVTRKAGLSAEISGLETPAEHVHVLSGMTDMEAEIFLLQTMAYGDEQARKYNEIVSAWKHGEIHHLAQIFAPEEREAPYLVQRIITRRNANWIPRIEAEMKTGKPTMIVVGARHLCGPYNVIDLLRHRGHKLTQL